MNRRDFLKAAGAGAAAFAAQSFAWAAGRERPNVLIMLADDAGYADLSCFGSPNIKTPNLDALASRGVRFTDFYASAPNCSPSRAGLLTGRFPARTGIYSYVPHGGGPMHLPETEITIAQLLKQRGYDTCHVGKWHLSHLDRPSQPQPRDFGFDHSLGTSNNAMPTHKNPVNFVRNGKPVGKVDGYSCQVIVDEGISWLNGRRDKTRPFFMYVCFHEPHERLASPPELVARHKDYHNPNKKKRAKMPVYFGCVENMDAAAGRLLKHLDETGLSRNTIVLFYSDNGSVHPESNTPLRERKSFVWDGGIRVPAVMRWPGHIRAGSTCSVPVGGVDMLPTLCEITGARAPADRRIDGGSILGVIEGKPARPGRPLYWFFYRTKPSIAVRQGDWTLVAYLEAADHRFSHSIDARAMAYLKKAKPVRFELYNMRSDVRQRDNLASREPRVLEAMKRTLLDLHQDVVAEGPVWRWK